jgi:hypothetical protein
VEGVSTGAAARGVRVVDGETLLLDGVFEVDGCTVEIRDAHRIDNDLDPELIYEWNELILAPLLQNREWDFGSDDAESDADD